MEMRKTKLDNYFNDDNLLKEYDVVKKFKSYNILKERVDLYQDFAINLLHKIYETYLGKNYIKSKIDIEGHYNWCFGKVLEEFYEQDIDFYGNDGLYNYFLAYYYDQFYNREKQHPINHHKKMWISIFNYKKQNKIKEEFELLVELYQIFDKSLEKKYLPVEV